MGSNTSSSKHRPKPGMDNPNELSDSFNKLRVSPHRRPENSHAPVKTPKHQRSSSSSAFVGGFSNTNATTTHGSGPSFPEPQNASTPLAVFPSGIPPLPRPPAISMPVPQPYNNGGPSLTMQHALATSSPPVASFPPWGSSTPPQASLQVSHPGIRRPLSDPPLPRPPGSHKRQDRLELPTPTKPAHGRASSAPVSPTAEEEEDYDPDRCQGRTRAAGHPRCTKRRAQVKGRATSPNAKATKVPLEDQDESFKPAWYCTQHLKQQLDQKGFISPRSQEIYTSSNHEDDGFVKYSDWIPPYLSDRTRVEIQITMGNPRSKGEEKGYIYTFEIRGESTDILDDWHPQLFPTDDENPDQINLKVGRAVNLPKRLHEWSKQCQSNTMVVRGYWPATSDFETKDKLDIQRGAFKPGPPGLCTHRLERIIHLHLADLVYYNQHNHPNFPNVTFAESQDTTAPSASTSGKGRPRKGSSPAASNGKLPLKMVQAAGTPCPDCGKVHKEIFSLIRAPRGPLEGKEYEFLIKPIIEKWGQFVSKYV